MVNASHWGIEARADPEDVFLQAPGRSKWKCGRMEAQPQTNWNIAIHDGSDVEERQRRGDDRRGIENVGAGELS